MYKSYNDLPLMLSVHDVAEVLGISKSSAYVLAANHAHTAPRARSFSTTVTEK